MKKGRSTTMEREYEFYHAQGGKETRRSLTLRKTEKGGGRKDVCNPVSIKLVFFRNFSPS